MEEKKKFDKLVYDNEYNKTHFSSFCVRIPKDLFITLSNKLEELNISKAEFLKNAIADLLKK